MSALHYVHNGRMYWCGTSISKVWNKTQNGFDQAILGNITTRNSRNGSSVDGQKVGPRSPDNESE